MLVGGVLNGNVYKYDVENRLVEKRARTNTDCSALSYAGTIHARLYYDPLGRLYEARGYDHTSGSLTDRTRFLYDGDALVAEYDFNNTMLARHVHGNDVGADDPLASYDGSSVAGGNVRLLYADPRGSIVLITNRNGIEDAINTYDEYGIPDDGNEGRFLQTVLSVDVTAVSSNVKWSFSRCASYRCGLTATLLALLLLAPKIDCDRTFRTFIRSTNLLLTLPVSILLLLLLLLLSASTFNRSVIAIFFFNGIFRCAT